MNHPLKKITLLIFLLALSPSLSLSQEEKAPAAIKEKPVAEAEAAEEAADKPEVEAEKLEAEGKSESEPAAKTEAEEEAEEEAADKANLTEGKELQQVYGWKEWIYVGTKADKMRAKLDSGAHTSSLHAEGVEEFERDGRKWVKFAIADPQDENFKQVTVKAPIERRARVKNTDQTVDSRYVVSLGFRIGDRKMREEFTLNDRTTMTCPVLIGRNALRHLGLLDCSRVDMAEKKVMK